MESHNTSGVSPIYVWMFRLFLFFVSTVVSLCLFEIYLQAYKPIHGSLLIENLYNIRFDNQLYEPKSNVWIFNQDGIADSRNLPTTKEANTYRIEIIGDSLAFGLGLHQSEKYSYVLEQKLNAFSSKMNNYEVINLGVSGYNIAQIITRLSEKGIKYKPDMVIYHMWLDDVYISDPGYASAASNPLLRLLYNQGGIESHKSLKNIFYKLFDLQITRYFLYFSKMVTNLLLTHEITIQDNYKKSMTPHIQKSFETYSVDYKSGKFQDLPWSESYFKSYTDINNFEFWNYYFAKFSSICQVQQITCVILISPVLYEHSNKEYNWTTLHTLIADVARFYKIEVIDETTDFDQYNGKDLRLPGKTDTEHPNAFAHTLIANRLFEYITSTIKIEQ